LSDRINFRDVVETA